MSRLLRPSYRCMTGTPEVGGASPSPATAKIPPSAVGPLSKAPNPTLLPGGTSPLTRRCFSRTRHGMNLTRSNSASTAGGNDCGHKRLLKAKWTRVGLKITERGAAVGHGQGGDDSNGACPLRLLHSMLEHEISKCGARSFGVAQVWYPLTCPSHLTSVSVAKVREDYLAKPGSHTCATNCPGHMVPESKWNVTGIDPAQAVACTTLAPAHPSLDSYRLSPLSVTALGSADDARLEEALGQRAFWFLVVTQHLVTADYGCLQHVITQLTRAGSLGRFIGPVSLRHSGDYTAISSWSNGCSYVSVQGRLWSWFKPQGLKTASDTSYGEAAVLTGGFEFLYSGTRRAVRGSKQVVSVDRTHACVGSNTAAVLLSGRASEASEF
ncbi:hypothetical protein JZ751_023951 [Albula glossodonta]|uniref:Uncharacterized protein n=1 Tax=Albula glossodonta TaxID=121402 RepID=A0A8T2NGY4_9TELE|nr:hypothetical protein JZ751_023951 [Albula glossodonta]